MRGQTITRGSFWWDRARCADADVPELRAVIFDVDGTLADTERDGHRLAYNAAFTLHDLDISWGPTEYGRLLKIGDGCSRVAADLQARGFGRSAAALATEVHRTKTALFADSILNGDITARPGLLDLVASLRSAGVQMAVATTGRWTWVEPLIRQLVGDGLIETMVCGDDVEELTPDPGVYLRALAELGVCADNALAVEDSSTGLRAALGAGLATVVVPTGYTADQDFTGAAAVLPGFDCPQPLTAHRCRRLHSRWWLRRQHRLVHY
jgi:HAD superfamily hydrolase (TIGR01509 family)